MDISHDDSPNSNPDSSADEGRSHFLETLGAGKEVLESLHQLRETTTESKGGVFLSSQPDETSRRFGESEPASPTVQLPVGSVQTVIKAAPDAVQCDATPRVKVQNGSLNIKAGKIDSAPMTPITLPCPKCQGELSLTREYLGVEGNCVWCQIPIVAAATAADGQVKVFPIQPETAVFGESANHPPTSQTAEGIDVIAAEVAAPAEPDVDAFRVETEERKVEEASAIDEKVKPDEGTPSENESQAVEAFVEGLREKKIVSGFEEAADEEMPMSFHSAPETASEPSLSGPIAKLSPRGSSPTGLRSSPSLPLPAQSPFLRNPDTLPPLEGIAARPAPSPLPWEPAPELIEEEPVPWFALAAPVTPIEVPENPPPALRRPLRGGTSPFSTGSAKRIDQGFAKSLFADNFESAEDSSPVSELNEAVSNPMPPHEASFNPPNRWGASAVSPPFDGDELDFSAFVSPVEKEFPVVDALTLAKWPGRRKSEFSFFKKVFKFVRTIAMIGGIAFATQFIVSKEQWAEWQQEAIDWLEPGTVILEKLPFGKNRKAGPAVGDPIEKSEPVKRTPQGNVEELLSAKEPGKANHPSLANRS